MELRSSSVGDAPTAAVPRSAARSLETDVEAPDGRDLAAMETLLNKEGGRRGLSYLSSDRRTLEAVEQQGHAGARLALEVFVHRLARHVRGLMTLLRRFDAFTFTGSIGEYSTRMRAVPLNHLAFFGLELDEKAGRAGGGGRTGAISRGAMPIAIVAPARAARLGGTGFVTRRRRSRPAAV